jgi:hypothetical protein
LSAHGANAQQDKDLQNFYADRLKTNGVQVSSDITKLPYADIQRIIDYNFDKYRAYDQKSQVRLVNGPDITLQSIVERTSAGVYVDSKIVERAKNIGGTSYPHAGMPIIDIKIGAKPPVRKGDAVKYFVTPKDVR